MKIVMRICRPIIGLADCPADIHLFPDDRSVLGDVAFKQNSLRYKITAIRKYLVTSLQCLLRKAFKYFRVTKIYNKSTLRLVVHMGYIVQTVCGLLHVPVNVLAAPPRCSLLYGPRSVTLQPDNRNDRPIKHLQLFILQQSVSLSS